MSDISIQVLPVPTKSEDIEAYRNYALEWKRNGRLEICKEMKAAGMAQKLKQGFVQKGYKLHMDSPTNQQFVCLPNADIDRLSAHATFELWGPRGEEETVVRFVTSWATREADVDALIDLL